METFTESNNDIIKRSEEMKKHLSNYIDSIMQHQETQMQESARLQETLRPDEDLIRAKVFEVFHQEKGKLGDQLLKRLQSEQPKEQKDNGLMDEFYDFCKQKLPQDEMYKESVLFVSLFYYFLEKKGMLKGN